MFASFFTASGVVHASVSSGPLCDIFGNRLSRHLLLLLLSVARVLPSPMAFMSSFRLVELSRKSRSHSARNHWNSRGGTSAIDNKALPSFSQASPSPQKNEWQEPRPTAEVVIFPRCHCRRLRGEPDGGFETTSRNTCVRGLLELGAFSHLAQGPLPAQA